MNLALKCLKVGLLYPHFPNGNNQDTRLAGVYAEQLEVPAGQLTVIVGRSGSGKSTLLNILASLKQANSAGADGFSQLTLWPDLAHQLDLLRGDQPVPGDIGFVFQEPHLLKPLPALSNYSAGAVIAGKNIDSAGFREFALKCDLVRETSEASPARESSDIARIQSLPVASLSGGQAQRISVGRALATDPRLLVCDEPTSSLDGETGRAVMNMIRDWMIEGKGRRSVVWVTHDLEQAAEFADGFVVTSHGRVITGSDGHPFPVIKGDAGATRRRIEETISAHQQDSPITLAELEKHNVTIDAVSAGYTQKSKATGSPTPGKSRAKLLAVFVFLFNCVRFEMFGNSAGGNGRGKLASLGGLLLRFSKWGMALSFVLGMVVLYASLLGKSVFEQYFDALMSEPKVSHFVITGSRATRKSDALFSMKGVQKLQNELVSTYATPEREGMRAPKVFGRWQIRLAEVVRAVDGKCPAKGQKGVTRKGVRPVLVADAREPLFAKLFNKAASIGSNGERVAIVTTAFSQWLGEPGSEQKPVGFCLPRLGKDAYFEIAYQVEALPGAGKYAYDIAIKDDDYLYHYENNLPTSAVDANGNTTYPTYSNAAVYFDRSYDEKIICEFFDAKKAAQSGLCNDARKRRGYITNSDVLSQLTGLINIANTTNSIIITVVVWFVILIAVSISFTLNAFIWKNEKFLSVLKAFRYNFRHLFFLGLFQAMLVLALAAIIALFVLVAAGPLVQTMATDLDIPASWLNFNILTFVRSFAILAGLSASVVAIVLFVWWRKNRYVGDKLQSI